VRSGNAPTRAPLHVSIVRDDAPTGSEIDLARTPLRVSSTIAPDDKASDEASASGRRRQCVAELTKPGHYVVRVTSTPGGGVVLVSE
jgi:hypothetical protein